jgi:hypothetical protein
VTETAQGGKRGFALTQPDGDIKVAAGNLQGGLVLMAGRDSLEKTIAKILHRHCEFGWAHYYIPSEKFPSLVEELLRVLQPAEEASEDELVKLFLGMRRYPSEQERVQRLLADYQVLRRGESR